MEHNNIECVAISYSICIVLIILTVIPMVIRPLSTGYKLCLLKGTLVVRNNIGNLFRTRFMVFICLPLKSNKIRSDCSL